MEFIRMEKSPGNDLLRVHLKLPQPEWFVETQTKVQPRPVSPPTEIEVEKNPGNDLLTIAF